MGKSWDSFVPGPEYWRECYRVLKPGGHLLAFSSTRTDDLLSIAIRFAGFERRDEIRCEGAGSLGWVQLSGFPKSTDVGRVIDMARCPLPGEHCDKTLVAGGHICPPHPDGDLWRGWGTALKPSWEPILVFRKPLDGTIASNALKWGTGGFNIDGCRVGGDVSNHSRSAEAAVSKGIYGDSVAQPTHQTDGQAAGGRWPANLVLVHLDDCVFEDIEQWACAPGCPVATLDHQSGDVGARAPVRGNEPSAAVEENAIYNPRKRVAGAFHADRGGASRIFFKAKSSRRERELGCEHLPARTGAAAVEREEGSAGVASPRAGAGRTAKSVRNHHVSVKPIELMRWLVRLVARPGQVVVDPFAGSGSTVCAAALEGVSALGIERENTAEMNYVDIARARLAYWRRVADYHRAVAAEGQQAVANTLAEVAGR